jgi:hypothetical protein
VLCHTARTILCCTTLHGLYCAVYHTVWTLLCCTTLYELYCAVPHCMVCFHMLSRLFSRLLLWQDYDLKFPAQIFASTEISTPSSESPISEAPSSEAPLDPNTQLQWTDRAIRDLRQAVDGLEMYRETLKQVRASTTTSSGSH